MTRSQKPKVMTDERGIVAILVTLIVMIVLSIVTISLAQVARREERAALDRQLSTEAYYAAESGINDAVALINNGVSPSSLPQQCSKLDTTQFNKNGKFITQNSGFGIPNNELQLPLALTDPTVGLGTQVTSQYTCVLVQSDPASLEYNQIASGNAAVANITTPTPAQTLVIGWQDGDGTSATNSKFRTLASCNSFPAATAWGATVPLIRLDVTDLGSGGNYSRSNLQNNTASYYLNPCQGTANHPGMQSFTGVTGTSSGNGTVVNGNCNTNNNSALAPKYCNANITFSPNVTNLLIRIKPMYTDAQVSVRALNGLGNALPLSGAQTSIDVTGQASDVLKRIQVRLPLNTSPYLYALQSVNSICKRLITAPGVPNGMTVYDTGDLSKTDQAACQGISSGYAGYTSYCKQNPGDPSCNGAKSYIRRLVNTSSIPSGEKILGCTWTYQYNQKVTGKSNDPSNACSTGQNISLKWDGPPPSCYKTDTVTLKVYTDKSVYTYYTNLAQIGTGC